MRIFEDISFSRPPLLLAAWPGMGNVGLIAIDYIRRTLGAGTFAELDMSPFYIPESIVVKDGLACFPEIPSSIFTYTADPPLVIFESNAQIGGAEGIGIIRMILDFAARFDTAQIVTAAAYAHAMSYQDPCEVLAAANSEESLRRIAGYGIKPMPDGLIAGQNGLILGVANARSLPALCLLGTIPSWATNLAYPKASREIVAAVSRIIGAEIDMSDLDESVAEMDTRLGAIEERIRQFFPAASEEDHDEELRTVEEDKVPQYIMDRIERMFETVRRDRRAAASLKEELDRWNLYELYEKRFLDLFKDSEPQ